MLFLLQADSTVLMSTQLIFYHITQGVDYLVQVTSLQIKSALYLHSIVYFGKTDSCGFCMTC